MVARRRRGASSVARARNGRIGGARAAGDGVRGRAIRGWRNLRGGGHIGVSARAALLEQPNISRENGL